MSEIHDDDAWFEMEVTSADYDPGPSPAVLRRRRIILAVALGSSVASIFALIAMATIVLRAPPREAEPVAAAPVPEPAAMPVEPAPARAPVALPPAPPLPAATVEVTMPVDRVAPTPRRHTVRNARAAHAPAAPPMVRKLREAVLSPMGKIAPASAPVPAKPQRYGHFN